MLISPWFVFVKLEVIYSHVMNKETFRIITTFAVSIVVNRQLTWACKIYILNAHYYGLVFSCDVEQC